LLVLAETIAKELPHGNPCGIKCESACELMTIS
jgi:hypothetical protein